MAHIKLAGGFIAGLIGTLALSGGQILALLFQNHPLSSIKASLALLLVFYMVGEFSYADFISGLYMMPCFVIGFFIAPMFVKYFNPKYSKTVVLSMAIVGALMLISKTFMGEV